MWIGGSFHFDTARILTPATKSGLSQAGKLLALSQPRRLTGARAPGRPSVNHDDTHVREALSDLANTLQPRRIGTRGVTGTHETRDAVDAGNTVRSEVRKFNRRAKSE